MGLNTFLNYIGTWTLGSFVLIDLLAATTNAFNGAILATRRDHRRNWTTIGIILMARKRQSVTTVQSGVDPVSGANVTERRTSVTPDDTI